MSTVRSQGSPLAALLKVGIALSLVLPAPAWAGQPGEEWGKQPAKEPTPAAEPDADIVLDDASGPPASKKPKARSSSKKHASASASAKAREEAIKAQIEKAEAERVPLQEQAQRLNDDGNLEGAVGLLAGGAEALRDPVLHLAAADARQKLARQRSADRAKADWEASLRHCEKAEALLAASGAGALDAIRVDPEETEALRAWSQQLRESADAALPVLEIKTNPVRRNARGELIAGSLFLAGGLAGVGVMAGGLYLSGAAQRELPKAEGRPEYLAPLEEQKRQGDTLIAAGAVAGALGVILGVTLVALGATDLKKSRADQLSRFRVAPTFGGLSLSGRF